MNKLFLDTAYLIALLSPTDKFHRKAAQLSEWIVSKNIYIVTTRAVLLEVGNALSKQPTRQIAVGVLHSFEQNEAGEIVPMSEGLYFKSFALFESRMDKEWGLVDCVSCVVMREQGITQVLTADRHFQQMGFWALLLDD